MSASDARRVNNSSFFGLYDFFSMFIPGTTLIIGLLPFLPQRLVLKPYELAFLVIILGYVVGRGVHSAAESADNFLNNPNHRDLFISALGNEHPNSSVGDLFDSFYNRAKADLPINGVPDDRTEASGSLLGIMYVHARSKLTMDGSGRAKTFQATFAFYRSIHFVMVALAAIYIFYSIVHYYELIPGGLDFITYIGGLGIPPQIMVGASEFLAGISFFTFHDAKGDHRQYYIQYLIQEYLIVTESEDEYSPQQGTFAR
ncbi:hypothetical protein [Halanaeroarchaeum sulfurireducens]|nr:hypothetical protein [Halanaeroarchaeum sulfurireducens]